MMKPMAVADAAGAVPRPRIECLASLLAWLVSLFVVEFIAGEMGAVPALAIAALLAELGGLGIIAGALKIDRESLRRIFTGNVRIAVTAAGSLAFGGEVRATKIPETLEEAVTRLENEIDGLRADSDEKLAKLSRAG